MTIAFSSSARRHRIGRARARHVMASTVGRPQQTARGNAAVVWVGPDDRGVELEVIAVLGERELLVVIHVMPTALRGRTP